MLSLKQVLGDYTRNVNAVQNGQRRLAPNRYFPCCAHNVKTLCLILLSFSFALGQTVTYSKAEQEGFHRLNMAMGPAKTLQTVESHEAVIDSIRQFLRRYPRSIYKSALFSYLLDLSSDLPSHVPEAKSMADSLLLYDSLSVTKLWIGEILVERAGNADEVEAAVLVEALVLGR